MKEKKVTLVAQDGMVLMAETAEMGEMGEAATTDKAATTAKAAKMVTLGSSDLVESQALTALMVKEVCRDRADPEESSYTLAIPSGTCLSDTTMNHTPSIFRRLVGAFKYCHQTSIVVTAILIACLGYMLMGGLRGETRE